MSAPPNPTSRDVAHALGIAQSTVSRAFTPGAPISEALRTRIHQEAERLGYRPNLLARGLIAGRSRLIGVLIAPQTNLLYPELLYELGQRLADDDRQLLLCPAEDARAAARAIARLQAFRVDAVLATGILAEADARALAFSLPLVTFNRLIEGVAGVSCDFAAAGAALARCLSEAGRRNFALILGPRDSWVSAEFARGVTGAIADAVDVRMTQVSADYAYVDAAPALRRAEDALGSAPDALLCVNDVVAAGCLDALRDRGRRVPQDVAVATMARSFPDDRSPRVAGMRQPLAEMIATAVDLLVTPRGDAPHRLLHATPVQGPTLPD